MNYINNNEEIIKVIEAIDVQLEEIETVINKMESKLNLKTGRV